jgi:hypothetical protein
MSTTLIRIPVLCLFFAFFLLYAAPVAETQSSCPNEPEGGGEGTTGSVSVNGGPELIGSAFVTAGTQVRLDSFAWAGGACKVKGWVCPQGTNCRW